MAVPGLQIQHDLEGSLTLDLVVGAITFVQALSINRKVLGEKHPDTAGSLNILGSLLQTMGDLAGAKPYYEQALSIFESKLGKDHPDTKIVRGNLESLLDAQ